MIRGMDQKIRLLYLNTKPERKELVLQCVAQAEFLIDILKDTRQLAKKFNTDTHNFLLADFLPEGGSNFAQTQIPIILLISPEEENMAVEALEQGVIFDYILVTSSTLERWPFIVRAAFARKNQITWKYVEDAERQEVLENVRGDYDAVVILDRFGKMINLSAASTFLSYYSIDEIKKINVFEFLDPKDSKKSLKIFQEMLDKPGHEEIMRVRIRNKNNHWHWYEVNGQNLLHDPLVQGILVRFKNITKLMQDEVQNDTIYRIAQATFKQTLWKAYLNLST